MKNTFIAYLIAIVCIAVALPAQAQDTLRIPFPFNKDGKIEYSEVVEVKDTKKADLYKRCKKWFATAYKSSKDVIQMDTEDEIIGKGNFSYSFPFMKSVFSESVSHTVTVSFKDGKYKYIINEIRTRFGDNPKDEYKEIESGLSYMKKNEATNKHIKEIQNRFDTMGKNLDGIIGSLKKAMSTKDEW